MNTKKRNLGIFILSVVANYLSVFEQENDMISSFLYKGNFVSSMWEMEWRDGKLDKQEGNCERNQCFFFFSFPSFFRDIKDATERSSRYWRGW